MLGPRPAASRPDARAAWDHACLQADRYLARRLRDLHKHELADLDTRQQANNSWCCASNERHKRTATGEGQPPTLRRSDARSRWNGRRQDGPRHSTPPRDDKAFRRRGWAIRAARRSGDETLVAGQGDGLQLGARAGLVQDVVDVGTDGALAQAQAFGDVGDHEARADQAQDL